MNGGRRTKSGKTSCIREVLKEAQEKTPEDEKGKVRLKLKG